MLLALGKQVVPSADDATLVLVVDHLQFVRLPRLPDLQRKGEGPGNHGYMTTPSDLRLFYVV